MEYDASLPQFSDVRLATGVGLRYAEQGDPAAPPIILLHGYTDSWFSFSRVLPSLAATHRTFVLSQRGHGDSDRPPGGYGVADFAADVVAFMEAKGLERVTLVGHCMGGFIAQRVALAAPARVARLVLVGSATTPCSEEVIGLRQEVETLEDPVPEEFARAFQEGTVYGRLPDEFMDRVVAESLKVPARVWRAALEGLLDAEYPAPLGRIQVPTLVLWGGEDAIFPRSEQDSLALALPNAVLKVYPETGHAPHWERPRQFVEDLRDFIAGPGVPAR